MRIALLAALAALGFLSTSVQAARSPAIPVTQFCDTRYCDNFVTDEKPSRRANRRTAHARLEQGPKEGSGHRRPRDPGKAGAEISGSYRPRIMPHPSGCGNRAYCGCGTALFLLGKAVRQGGLAIASEWLKRFPRAACAPRMAAARPGHVFAIIECLPGNKALAYDPNSGGHLTRIHVRSLAGYTVVDPGATKVAAVEKHASNEDKKIIVASLTDVVSEKKPAASERTIATTFNDRHTACAPFRLTPGKLEVAHPSLPCGTKVKVENLRNGRIIVAEVTDIGPCTTARCRKHRPDIAKHRHLDLDPDAARALRSNGKARVRYTVLQ